MTTIRQRFEPIEQEGASAREPWESVERTTLEESGSRKGPGKGGSKQATTSIY